eukprot:TRINITY_DN4535_c0_g1_i1.p1 TRINITY_DN4535_c0_g1~~TRINITY_DN4535_c0_g1_i1.p1  ORF type:complete len:392 (-),score=63.35 TRINITY_DN4535_c0_g1_i1:68-1243(-)
MSPEHQENDDEPLDPVSTSAETQETQEQFISACPPYSELTYSEHQTIDFRENSGIVLNLQHTPSPHFFRSVAVGTINPVLTLQYSSDQAFLFASEGSEAPSQLSHSDDSEDEEIVPAVHLRELPKPLENEAKQATEQVTVQPSEQPTEQPTEQAPEPVIKPQSPFSYHLISNYHFGISAVEGTAALSWKNRYKLVTSGLSIPPGFATPSYINFAASYVGETYTLEAEYESKENKTELNCTTLITPLSYLFGTDSVLFAGTKVVSVLPFQKPNFTSLLHFASSLWGVSWNMISSFDIKSSWSLSLTHNFGIDGALATHRWQKSARSRIVTFATGLAVEANPFTIKLKIDQAKGICCGFRTPFFLGPVGLSLSYLTTGQQQGLGFGLTWDIMT